jgi:hypothetical protein
MLWKNYTGCVTCFGKIIQGASNMLWKIIQGVYNMLWKIIQVVSNILWKNSVVSKTGKSVYNNTSPQTITFRGTGTASIFIRLQSIPFFYVETLKPPNVFSSNWKWTSTYPAHFYAYQILRYPPPPLAQGFFERKWPPSSGVPKRVIIQVEDIRSISCEPWRNIQYGLCSYKNRNIHSKCIVIIYCLT